MTLGVMKKGIHEGCNYMVQWAVVVYIVVYYLHLGTSSM